MDSLHLFWTYGLRFSSLIFVFGLVYKALTQKNHIQESIQSLYLVFMGGIVLIPTFFAIYTSGGKSIMWLCLPLMVYVGWLTYQAPPLPRVSLQSSWIPGVILLSFFVYTWSFLSIINFTDIGFYVPSGLATQENDFFIYCQRAQYLGISGQENYFGVLNVLDTQYQGNTPYHYLELWLGAALSKIFGIPHVFSMGLLVKPLFYLSSSLGLWAIIEVIRKQLSWKDPWLIILLLFLSGMYVDTDALKLGQFNLSMLTYRYKMIVYYPFFIGFVVMILQQKSNQAFVFLAGLMVATVVVVPAVLGGTILLCMYRLWRKDKSLVSSVVLLGITTLLIFLFYLIMPSPSLQASMGIEGQELFASFSFLSLLKIPIDFLANFLRLIPIFISSFLMLFLAFRIINKDSIRNTFIQVLGAFTLMLIAGSCSYALLKDFENAIQLFFNPAIVCLNLIGILAIMLIYIKKPTYKWVWVFSLI